MEDNNGGQGEYSSNYTGTFSCVVEHPHGHLTCDGYQSPPYSYCQSM